MAVINHRWRAIFLCVSSAVTFWIFNALNKEYTTTINYPVRFVVDETKRTFTEKPPQSIPLEVTGGGWILLRYLLHIYVKPAELPVVKVARRGRVSRQRLYTLLKRHVKDLKVNRITGDMLEVHTKPKSAR